MDEGAGTSALRIVDDATCLGCACLCDDIGLIVEGDRIVEARNACERGRGWFAWAPGDEPIGPTMRGKAVSLDEVLDRAAAVLATAKSPVVFGLGATVEAQRIAVAIADRIGATVSPSLREPAGYEAFQRLGSVGATLGEIRDRADVIVFDSPHWPQSLPRFLERFVDSPGRFVPEGRSGRTVIVFPGDGVNFTADKGWTSPPDVVFDLPGGGGPSYAILRALVNGVSFEPAAFEAEMGVPLLPYMDLTERMRRAKYGVLIHQPETQWPTSAEAASALVRDLNRSTRFVALAPSSFAQDGAGAVVAWQTGWAGHVDFALGYPRDVPDLDLLPRVRRREMDAALVVGDVDFSSGFRTDLGALADLPTVYIGQVAPEEDRAGDPDLNPLRDLRRQLLRAEAFIPTARTGIDAGGTVARFDGVMLPLRPPFPARRPSQAEILRGIGTRLVALKDRGR
jgi:formylmethanofuran dehydrogenase subunit B